MLKPLDIFYSVPELNIILIFDVCGIMDMSVQEIVFFF